MGNIGAGKDKICDYLVARHAFIKRGFSDPIYEQIAKLNPWIAPLDEWGPFGRYNDLVVEYGADYVKRGYPEIRMYLQTLGSECALDLHGPNCWVKIMAQRSRSDGHTCIRDCRFPSEIDWVRSQDSLLIRVTGDREQEPSAHISDFAIDAKLEADYTVFP